MLSTSYSSSFVLVSIFVAILASYTALDMAGRITRTQGQAARWWLTGGACAMGIGIWSMHFVGMLALSLPIPLGYDPAITVFSLMIAIASSAFALWLATREVLPWRRLILGALIMGSGISGMHYSGMAAMLMQPGIEYAPLLFTLSVAVSITVSGVALWIAFRLQHHSPRIRILRIIAACVMGVSIVGMHYIGMAAARFPLGSICGAAKTGIDIGWLGLVIIIATLGVLTMALTISVLDQRLESKTTVLASSLAQANKELTYLTLHDNLTKLPNRLLLEDRLERAIQGADNESPRFALMFMDLDGFKTVNDGYGHHVGDLLLIQIAERVKQSIRTQDTIARVGGDEFVLLADVVEPSDAATLADKIATAIRKPFAIAGRELRVSASIGIAMYPGDGSTQHQLLTNADAAMYHAKMMGRDTYCFFETSMNANVHKQLQLTQDLRLALDRGELVLHYQPKFTAPSGPITGIEALVRWMHPTHGLIPPDEFIPLAEKTGLIVPIGAWVLDKACQQLKTWHNTGFETLSVAVNLSALQFRHDALVQTVCDTLTRHAVAAHHLTLEVTESTAMHDVEASLRILQQLNDMGVRISIDDFGTGYSSLLHLKRLPATELKIDRGFINDLSNGSEDTAIVSAIIALGQALDLNIVAEGVETSTQQGFLTNLGCDTLQGFLLGRPMSAEDLNEALARNKLYFGDTQAPAVPVAD